MRQAKKEKKKILLPNFVHTRPRQENSEKNSKKIEKIKKPLSDIFFQLKWDEIGREREKKILLPNSVQSRLGQENYEKNCKKIEQIKKNLFPILISAKTV